MFHTNLKKLRLISGLSQKQIADYLNITPQSISKWENGESLPSIYYLPKLAQCLNCDINAFFAVAENNKIDCNVLCKFMALLNELRHNETKTAEELIAFENKHPSTIATAIEFFESLIKQKNIYLYTVREMLNCTDDQANLLTKQLYVSEIIEKLDTNGTYLVLRAELESVLTVLYIQQSKIENPNNPDSILDSLNKKLKNLTR